jgi:hypothetical protein
MIVIPMAGDSRRFTLAGYTVPKYRLEAHGKSLFAHAVESFTAYFATEPFRFVFREGHEAFIRAECARLGVRNASFVSLPRPTAGQAETVQLGLGGVPDVEPVTIFNIDTFRPGFRFPDFTGACDGFLEVFEGAGDNWSFVRPDPADPRFAAETAEKRAISNLCCTGLYHFASAALFREAYAAPLTATSEAERRERYVAPLHNALIRAGRRVRISVIPKSSVIFCGTPQEYDAVRGMRSPG